MLVFTDFFTKIKNTFSNQDFAALDKFNKLEDKFCMQEVTRKLN